ncbi:MAG: biosynthetic peptidoglycan transglycosylase [Phenylobacterium sp.]|uniref:biosynthetic peptidoglycan transglycosylase n=1 Tax=Phenylobacterium sp. TaxID=1871053 RepID=UPI00391A34A2
MSYKDPEPRLFGGDSRGRRAPPGLKSFLFTLNLQMDWLLDRIQHIRWGCDPIIQADGVTEIERLTLVLEDRRFFQHSGIDWRFIPRVVRQFVTFKRVGGVSTIEQQLVRTILQRRERTIRRKSREMLLAWVLSYRMSKRDILRTYLTTAYFGYRLRGCDEAANLLYGANAADLDPEQSAFVASLLVYPLPKVAREKAEQSGLHPISDHAGYIQILSSVAPKWAKRIRRRMAFGLALRLKAK